MTGRKTKIRKYRIKWIHRNKWNKQMTRCQIWFTIELYIDPISKVLSGCWTIFTTLCYQYLWLTMWFMQKNRKLKNKNRWFYFVHLAPKLRNDEKLLIKNGKKPLSRFRRPSQLSLFIDESGWQQNCIIYIMLLSDLEKLLSVWENVLSIANVT